MKKIQKTIYFLLALIFTASLFASPILAESDLRTNLQDTLKTTGGTAYYDNANTTPGVTDPTSIISNIIKVILGFLGIIFVVLIIISGYQWMTAGGNEQTITQARQRIINATIGVVIVLAVFIIAEYVLEQVVSIVE